MFETSQEFAEEYAELLSAVKSLNRERKAAETSQAYKLGKSILTKKAEVKKHGLKGIAGILKKHRKFKKGESFSMSAPLPNDRDYGESNYFSDQKIAVYTCITGGYDRILEPVLKPDNCNFYAVTDFEFSDDSMWTRIDPKEYSDRLQGLSNAEENRFFKMHPDILFPEYKYSIYLDGNIELVTDPTEYVNRISRHGISFFAHSQRDCIFEEAKACVAMGKDTEEHVSGTMEHFRNDNMPEHYGMAQCSFIVREHNAMLCKELMDEWWKLFLTYAKRDQLSLPYVLYKHNIPVDEVTTLGANIYRDDSFKIVVHA